MWLRLNQLLFCMAKIFMIGFEFKGVSHASNVFFQERSNHSLYHLKLAKPTPSLFNGTLILEKTSNGYHVNSPSNFSNNELLDVLIDALNKQETVDM
jgi:hypothetical protein